MKGRGREFIKGATPLSFLLSYLFPPYRPVSSAAYPVVSPTTLAAFKSIPFFSSPTIPRGEVDKKESAYFG